MAHSSRHTCVCWINHRTCSLTINLVTVFVAGVYKSRATKFCTVAPNIYGSSVCNLLHFIQLGRPGLFSRYSESLRARLSGDRIPVGERFSTSVQTGHGVHPASCTMGTGSFLVVKRPGRGADTHPIFSAEVLNRVQLYFYLP